MKQITVTILLFVMTVGLASAESIQRELEARPGETLEVILRSGSIEILGWDRSAVSIDATTAGGGASNVDVIRTDRGLTIEERRSARGNLRHLRINVPRRFNLELDTMGGTISVTGVEGSLRGTTLGGDLDLSRLGGQVEMRTHGGNVTLRDSNVDGSVTTMGGRVLMENVVGDVQGTSMGGNVVSRNLTRRDGRSTGKAVVISTMGGEIEVADAPAGAELSTMGGNVHVARAGSFVKARTMGGTIRLDAVDGWIEAKTMGGDIEATMVGDPQRGDRHVLIDSKGGDIELTVPAGLQMEIDIEVAFTRDSGRNYAIRSDFPLSTTTTPEWDYDHGTARRYIQGKGKAGSGAHKVTIRTINGDVRLRKR
ncbi:MAG TPA: hypothetical protein VM557_08930 [Thermoanaerobaculia bacterium]|nr:hypothetical protein [Thermoanaerobaculia bacterium]